MIPSAGIRFGQELARYGSCRTRGAERASTIDAGGRHGPAGTVVELRDEGPVVACGEGALLLEEVETGAGELAVGARLG